MGVAGSLSHYLVRIAIRAVALWLVFVLIVGIPIDKMPQILLFSFVVEILASIFASVLLAKHWGWS